LSGKAVRPRASFADSGEIYKAEMYAHDILGNLNAGINASLDWNLLLDEKGGPNHVGNFCAAPIMCAPGEDSYEKRLTYYYIGHFSRFIKRGAKRMLVSRFTSKVEACGFVNPDGEKIMILLN
jgi:glucosylceramidase